MAKQTGVIRYSGNLGGISHYKMKGVTGDLAKIANGPSKEQIMKDPAFKRTRENNLEFGASAKTAKNLRVGLASVIKGFSDPQVAGRITKVFKAINLEGTGPRGKRRIDLSLHRAMLDGFEFDKNISFGSVFTAQYSITENAARNESTIDIQPFNPLDYVNAPAGATHFRLINGLAVVSDVRYNAAQKAYAVVVPTLDGLNDITYTPYLPLDSSIGTNTIITSTLPGLPTMSTDVSVVNVIGIEFFQEVGGEYYLFAAGNAMQVGKVF
jgi:hypothetical protein